MAKQKTISSPKSGMNRALSPHLLSEQEYAFQLNGNSYDEGGEKFNLTDEHSNILATKFKQGFKFIGGKNHIVRGKTYVFLTNPITKVSEIGCILSSKNITEREDQQSCTSCNNDIRVEAAPLETVEQIPHQSYETLLEDSCNLCLGFNIDHPIVDIIIKEQNIGTKMFWTSTPGDKTLRYVEIEDIEQYKLTGDDNCGNEPESTCIDCDKLRVFKLYRDLETVEYKRTVGGSLKKGSYEILGAYSDILGNEFTSYKELTGIIPIFDQSNIIHEQVDNNAETNFAIKLTLEKPDTRFDYYKIAVRYYTSKGVFVSFVEGIHNTSDTSVIISNNNGESISNQKLAVKKPFIESVDGLATSNEILILNGIKEREPINLQPVMSLAGLAMQWMSYRAKEDLYSNADSYRFAGYNRDENIALAVDFGFSDGFRTNLFSFIPRPPTSEEVAVIDSGRDFESISEIVGKCDENNRNKVWQIRNTATEIGACPYNEEGVGQVQTEVSTTYTTVTLPSVPAGEVTLTTDQLTSFTDLKSFIQKNIETCKNEGSVLQNICQYTNLDNLTEYNNVPDQDNCADYNLLEETVGIGEVANEVITLNDKDISEYEKITPSNSCDIFSINLEGTYTIDEAFSYAYNVSSYQGPNDLTICSKKRNESRYNFECTSAEELFKARQDNLNSANTGFFYHLNRGATVREDLLSSKIATVQSGDKFSEKVHKGALWFKTELQGRDKFFIEISQMSPCADSCVSEGSEVRLSFFDTCTSTTSIFSKIINLGDHQTIEIDRENNLIDGAYYDFSTLLTEKLYISVEVGVVESEGYGPNWQAQKDQGFPNPPATMFRLAPLCGCFNIVDRSQEYDSGTVSYDNISLTKSQKYRSECSFSVPSIKDCEPIPYKYGNLGHYESTDTYPDNDELYNSSRLVIKKDRISNTSFLEKLRIYMQNETEEEIALSELADFRCKNIRHYKTPDNKVSPFIQEQVSASNTDSIISPLGFTIDGEVINNLLDVAVDNNLITQEQRDNITDYKIYRSDLELDRSVVGSGLVFNTKSYTVEGENINYFNYPFNSLGEDKYFKGNTDNSFDKFQAISPEFDYYRPTLPNEMTVQGFMFGKSNSRVVPVDEHSKMVILGRDARRLANTLAVLEVTAEILITAAMASSNAQVWAVAGPGSTGGSAGIPAFAAAAAIGLAGALESIVSKVGRIRLEWLKSFEDLGSPHNFGYYTTAGSNYNYLKTLQTEEDKLRGLSVGKYLKSGMLNVSDTTSGEVIKVNNIDREEAAFFSLGGYPIENLSSQYTNFDNTDVSPSFSSQILSSEIGCHEGKSPEQTRNIASPYVAFKNYKANQYGTLNSIKWVDTTYKISIEETGIKKGVLGGDTFISRHSKKRKVRMFETDLLGQADLTPFPYRYNANYGDPRYYIDYKVNSEFESQGTAFPDIFYDVQFDCDPSTNGFYVKPPGKFYLYSTSFVNFLCETRINTNFRNARKEPWNQFYPQNTDYETITQPNTVSLTRPENFFYNKAYLQTAIQNTNFILPDYYSKENEAKKAYNRNSGVYSLPDVNENSITEPWLLYRPNDKFTLDSRYGNLVNMKGIESGQVLMYFEDALQLQNAVNQFTDGSTKYNSDLGNGGLFAKRALTLKTTDLGYGGSQSKQTLSCEFGHFHADIKRGQVFNYLGGNNLQEISRYSNNKPNGMDIWFKEHLPLKFLKYFPEFDKVDNPYNGIGVHWGYDSKYRRVILTKKDYIPVDTTKNYCTTDEGIYDPTPIQSVIEQKESEGFSYVGIEDCKMKFEVESITSTTDVYAIFDTTSMQVTDGAAAAAALQSWFSNYKSANPSYEGNLYILPYSIENYVNYPQIIVTGQTPTTNRSNWGNITILPPNHGTPDWEPPTDLLLLAFVDEAHSGYHSVYVSDGFDKTIIQPTSLYDQDYENFINLYQNNLNFFKGIVYPIVQSTINQGGALVLQALAAIEGTKLTQEEVDATNTTVDVSVILTENPYENHITANGVVLQPLKELGWKGQYDKVSPASEVFSSDQFQNDLNNLINDGTSNTTVVYEPLNKIEITDKENFKEVSWTITYRPETGSWESYMSYTPNYYINHTDYFQSGMNTDDDTFGLWSHLLSNKSYRVYYGHKFPYIFEYPIKNQYIVNRLESFNWNAQLKRYHNEYDYATIVANPFSAVTIYNNYENSGRLVPVMNNGTISQLSKYPKNNSDNTQDVLISYDKYKYSLSYFYNRVKSNTNNQSIWEWDENQIGKTINPKAITFYGKKTLERMKGNFFMVRLERNGNTNYDLDFRWSEQTLKQIR